MAWAPGRRLRLEPPAACHFASLPGARGGLEAGGRGRWRGSEAGSGGACGGPACVLRLATARAERRQRRGLGEPRAPSELAGQGVLCAFELGWARD